MVANILWNSVLYRREEEVLAFLVLGKMLVGPLCHSLDDFGWHIPEAPVALGNGLAMKGFWGFTLRTQFCGYHESGSGAVWKI